MKATVLIPFRDKHDHKVVYSPGDVKEFDNDRVVALAARGLVKPLKKPPKPKKAQMSSLQRVKAKVKVKTPRKIRKPPPR